MRFEYDLSNAPVMKAVPDGIYLLQAVQSKAKENDKGNTDVMYEFKIVQPDPCVVDEETVTRIFIHYYINPKDPDQGMGFLRPLFKACGKLVTGTGFDTDDIVGDIFGAEIVRQEGTPEYPTPKNQIRNYFPQDDMPPVQFKETEGANAA